MTTARPHPRSRPLRPAEALQIARRLVHLYLGLILFGVSVAMMIASGLGLSPWDVLHQGIAQRTHLPYGWVVNGIAALTLMAWIPLRERPGLGTFSNVIVVGLVVDAALAVLPDLDRIALKVAFLFVGIIVNGLATGLYIGAELGPGPRDGLMLGIARRGYSIRATRTSIEMTVFLVGWLLGGTVGLGTLLYSIGIGPLTHYFVPKLKISHSKELNR